MYLHWKTGGLLLAITFVMAIWLVKPIGISTQFVIFDAIVADLFVPELIVEDENQSSGYSSTNAYLNKAGGKYAKAAAEPINYGFVFVLSVVLGGYIGGLVSYKDKALSPLPRFHTDNFGETSLKRNTFAFIGGVISLFGARLAGGCTSGHMMSGMMQTSISGYIFAAAVFAAAVPTAILLYKK